MADPLADHLDFIRIRGLEDSDTEVFQGLGASGLPTSPGSGPGNGTGGGTGSTPAALDWGTVGDEVLTQLQQYYTAQQDWLTQMEALGDQQEQAASAAQSRGVRELPAVIPNAPMIPVLLATLATGGASVPVVLGEILIQVGLSVADAQLRKLFNRLDPNSPENQIKALVEAINDLKYNDEVVDFGAVRIHHKGKVIEY